MYSHVGICTVRCCVLTVCGRQTHTDVAPRGTVVTALRHVAVLAIHRSSQGLTVCGQATAAANDSGKQEGDTEAGDNAGAP
jgi:aerobic-type carbon monoxide dehydrogenase small subunit (CoxS/CutS family)